MAAPLRPLERLAWRALARADAVCNRLYGWKGNPLYQSGTIAAALLGVLIVTGTWLLLFYKVSAPYQSVAGVTAARLTGNWVRGLHLEGRDADIARDVVSEILGRLEFLEEVGLGYLTLDRAAPTLSGG